MTDTSQLATERRCGRLDPHEPHRWTVPLHLTGGVMVQPKLYRCTGFVLIEGGEGCALCQRPVAACGCYARLVEARRREWYQ